MLHGFSIDIAFPDIKFGIEVNGNQHYNSDGTLKPYYKERHDLIEKSGWILLELHYSSCYIDDILEKEEAARTQLQRALDEARLNNEIISAIAKNYCSIYRIDLQRDYFEEISNDDETHRLTGNNGCASEKLYQLCDATVVPEYRDLVRRFLDVLTLAERLKNEEYISTEYRMCDGSWHSLRFVAKKRDEAGNVTHVLCTVRCRAVWKVRTRLFRRDLYGYYDAAYERLGRRQNHPRHEPPRRGNHPHHCHVRQCFFRGYYGQPSGGHGYSPGQTAGRSQDDQRLKAVHRRTECRKAAERFVTLCSGQPKATPHNSRLTA